MNPAADPLAALRDVHTVAPPEFWPPAPGWWLLALIALSLLLFLGVKIKRRLRLSKQRHEVLSLLDQAAVNYSDQPIALATNISKVLRRVAIRQFPVKDVASLNGNDWLRFLDQTGGNGQFRSGPGAVIATAPYGRADDYDQQRLLKLARSWVRKNYQ